MSYTPQAGSLAAKVCDHMRAHPGIELTESQIAGMFAVKHTAVTACLVAPVQYKLLDRVRSSTGISYVAGRKLHGSQVDIKAAASGATAPAPKVAPAPQPAPVRSPVSMLMRSTPAPAPIPTSPPATRLLARLPSPDELQINPSEEEVELQQAVDAYHPVLQRLRVGQSITVPSHLGADMFRVCESWGQRHGITFLNLPNPTSGKAHIKRAA